MKRILFVLIFIGHSIVYTFGQQTNPSGQSLQTSLFAGSKDYSIGINTQFAVDGLLDQNIYTPLEFIVRKLAKDGQAFRVRAGGMIWHTDQIEGDERLETNRSQATLALGYEWHQPLGSRFGFYYGAELENKWENHNDIRNGPRHYPHLGDVLVDRFDFVKTYSVGLAPLAGFIYCPLPYLSISVEMRLEIMHKNIKMTSDTFFAPVEDPNNIMEGSWGKYDQKGWYFNFQPYSGIFINLNL